MDSQIFAPPPLKGSGRNSNGSLTYNGVIYWTNLQRQQNGNFAFLKENAQLDQAAELKLQDMFKQQYFEHVNPQGKGPSDLAREVGYAFVTYGENLALGDFDDDQALVGDWMNSPGHRANILNAKYQEIGVAVGQGNYQGRQTWLAVQEFGRPASSCPQIDPNLKSQIDSLTNDINQQLPQVNALKSQLDSARPQTSADYQAYNETVTEYNNLVNSYNNKVDQLKLITGQYNAQVSSFNLCLAN